jgi:hypothetical protein
MQVRWVSYLRSVDEIEGTSFPYRPPQNLEAIDYCPGPSAIEQGTDGPGRSTGEGCISVERARSFPRIGAGAKPAKGESKC